MGEDKQVSHSDWLEEFFDDRGRWIRRPDPSTVRPEALLENQEFWTVFDQCLDDLPPRHREAFARRVIRRTPGRFVRRWGSPRPIYG